MHLEGTSRLMPTRDDSFMPSINCLPVISRHAATGVEERAWEGLWCGSSCSKDECGQHPCYLINEYIRHVLRLWLNMNVQELMWISIQGASINLSCQPRSYNETAFVYWSDGAALNWEKADLCHLELLVGGFSVNVPWNVSYLFRVTGSASEMTLVR